MLMAQDKFGVLLFFASCEWMQKTAFGARGCIKRLVLQQITSLTGKRAVEERTGYFR